MSFTGPAIYPDIRLAEYSGLDPNNPLDVVASATGNSATSATRSGDDHLRERSARRRQPRAEPDDHRRARASRTRVITSPDGDILEDRIVTATGSYSASAPIAAAPWIMQLAAFRRHP